MGNRFRTGIDNLCSFKGQTRTPDHVRGRLSRPWIIDAATDRSCHGECSKCVKGQTRTPDHVRGRLSRPWIIDAATDRSCHGECSKCVKGQTRTPDQVGGRLCRPWIIDAATDRSCHGEYSKCVKGQTRTPDQVGGRLCRPQSRNLCHPSPHKRSGAAWVAAPWRIKDEKDWCLYQSAGSKRTCPTNCRCRVARSFASLGPREPDLPGSG
jgi:hypothetical protein